MKLTKAVSWLNSQNHQNDLPRVYYNKDKILQISLSEYQFDDTNVHTVNIGSIEFTNPFDTLKMIKTQLELKPNKKLSHYMEDLSLYSQFHELSKKLKIGSGQAISIKNSILKPKDIHLDAFGDLFIENIDQTMTDCFYTPPHIYLENDCYYLIVSSKTLNLKFIFNNSIFYQCSDNTKDLKIKLLSSVNNLLYRRENLLYSISIQVNDGALQVLRYINSKNKALIFQNVYQITSTIKHLNKLSIFICDPSGNILNTSGYAILNLEAT